MKNLLFKLLFIAVAIAISATTFAQHNHDGHNHDDNTTFHQHSEWELGLAIGAVPLLDEKTIAPGIHLHLLQKSKLMNGLMIGLGFESILDEHTHVNAGLVFNYNIYKGLFAAISPGILWMNHDGWETTFATHFELSYEWEVGKLHLGPIVEYSYSSLDKHIMAGLHLGIGF